MMNIFGKKKKMNEENIIEEMDNIFDNEDEIKVNDKRRINIDGERLDFSSEAATATEKAKSPEMVKLEAQLIEERIRREAAESKLVGVQAKFDEMKTQIERETAEMRQRMMKTLEERAKQSQANFITTLLPVLDNLNLAINAAEKDASFEKLIGGVKGTARSFENALLSVGVEAVPAIGEVFNPELHEAVEMVPVDSENDGKVVGEFSRGYKFGERLLRPTRVQVGRAS